MKETKPKAFVFTLMAFDKNFQDVYVLGIKSACENAGAYCERVDEQIFVENILERIYNQIAKADIIVAEMSGRNPNVFYKVGYAHALNKRVILLTQNADDIPFDLKQFPHIVYDGEIVKLKSQLENKVRWCIENPIDSLARVDVNLQFFVNATPIEGKPEILFRETTFFKEKYTEQYNREFGFEIGIHNLTKRLFETTDFNFALIVPNIVRLKCENIFSVNDLPDGTRFFNMKIKDTLFPDSWQSFKINFDATLVKPTSVLSYELILRVLTPLGSIDYPFTLKLTEIRFRDFRIQDLLVPETKRKSTRKK